MRPGFAFQKNGQPIVYPKQQCDVGSKTKYSTVTLQVTVKFSTVCNNMLKRRSYKCVAGKNTAL